MFYEPRKKNHGLPHDPYTAIVGPRPIGWISSMNSKGEINLAPYSFFNSVSSDPPMVMFASDGRKDTLEFVEETKEFVCNLAVWDLRDQMKETSWTHPRGVNEMEAAGLEAAPSILVKPPRVSASPCALECKWLQTVQLIDIDGNPARRFIVFGQVVGIHIDERFIKDGLLDTADGPHTLRTERRALRGRASPPLTPRGHYSGLMPANFTTLRHFSVSSTMR
jgi:flavin reductase (DIM6/NTAB) family NADH-FMN oxidoreductase RutF